MENCGKFPLILTQFSVLFLLSHLAVTDSLSPYTPTEAIFIACGSSGNFSLNDRTWVGDVNSKYSPLETPKNSSTIFTNPGETPYSTSRLSRSQFIYTLNLTSGQKFIRLHFYSASYSGFDISKAFFSVKAGSLTLLDFNASLTADYLGDNAFFKEFCINVDDDQSLLNIPFTPSPNFQDSYAFVSGIEIVSMPPNLYYTAANDTGFQFVGPAKEFRIRNSSALETLYRINVGGDLISPSEDTGMHRTWTRDDFYFKHAWPSAVAFNYTLEQIRHNITFVINLTTIHYYSAPAAVYETGRRLKLDWVAKEDSVMTWEFEVDSGFTYFLRLHFCELYIAVERSDDRMFEIYIADRIAEPQANVLAWSEEQGPAYRDYAVLTVPKGSEKKQTLSISLRPTPPSITNHSDPILNGLEIFKVDNGGNLAALNPDPNISPPSNAEIPSSKSKKSKNNRATIVAVVGGLVSSFVVISLLILFLRSKFSTSKTKPRKSRGSSLTSDLCTHFSLSEIKAATNNFDSALIVGVGGFGNVYKGFINGGITPVAVKRLNPGSEQGALEFQTEIEMLSQLVYIHLLTLIGYCNDDEEMILVYDFMARGTLRDHLYNSNNPPLPWNQRLNLCIGAARGLHYLHTSTKQVIIHRDVKTTNILLDENWVAKVSDFGLSKFGPNSMSKTHISTVVKGSIGYLDPEYYRLQRLTEKSDVYSFGVVLLEVLCARPPIIRTMDENQVSLAIWGQQCYLNGTIDEIVDPFLKSKINSECLNKYVEVAISCLKDYGKERPSMSDVVRGLEFAFQLQERADEKEQLGEIELSTIRSNSKSMSKDVFSDIMNPHGR